MRTKKAKSRLSLTLNILLEYGVGILCCLGLAVCGALFFSFGIFLLNGWLIFLGVVAALGSYIIFTAKEDYDELSLKEAVKKLFAGKEVSK